MTRILCLAAAIAAAGCASLDSDTQLAQADCRIAPATLASSTGAAPRRVDSLDRRYAEMQLATSDYRWRRLQQPLNAVNNNIEEALRDCDRAQ